MRDPKSGDFVMFNQLHKPRVVYVASQVSRFEATMPETGHEHDRRNGHNLWPFRSQKLRGCPENSRGNEDILVHLLEWSEHYDDRNARQEFNGANRSRREG